MEKPLSQKPLLWYSIIVKPMMEKKFFSFMEKMKADESLSHRIGEIYIPFQQEDIFEKDGTKKVRQKKVMPGYVFVQLSFDEEIFETITGLPIVSGFLGGHKGQEPPNVPQEEIDRLRDKIQGDQEVGRKTQFDFVIGDKVLVKEGPFRSFKGEVDQVKPDRTKVKLLISVFGRSTPLEIECSKIEKIFEESN